jgi:hypothetical protein
LASENEILCPTDASTLQPARASPAVLQFLAQTGNSLLLGIPIRIESTSDVGERLFRIYDIRYEEPPAEAFVLAPE